MSTRRSLPLLIAFLAALPIPATARPLASPAAPAVTLSASEAKKREAIERFLKARLLLNDGEVSVALQEFRKAVQLDPEDGHLRREYADVLRELQILPEAETEARKAVALIPENPAANRTLGQILLTKAKEPATLEEAAKHLKIATDALPGDPAGGSAYAQVLLRLDRPKDAIPVLERILDRGRGFQNALLYGEALERTGQLSQAEDIYRSVLRQEPDNPPASFALLRVFERSRQYDKAIPLLEELSRRQPNNLAVKTQLGWMLLRARKFPESSRVLSEVLKSDPGNADARRFYATLLSETLETDKADEVLRKLQEIEPDDPDVPFRRAMNFLEARRLDEAEKVLMELRQSLVAKKLGPRELAQVDGQLAYTAYLRRDFTRAKELVGPLVFPAAVEIPGATALPNSNAVNEQALNLALQIARDQNDDEGGKALAKEAIKRLGQPGESGEQVPALRATLAEFLLRSRVASENAQGEELLGSLIAEGGAPPSRSAVLAAADAWQRLEKHGKAVKAAERGLVSNPDDPELLFRLAASLERDKKIPESVKAFERLISLKPDHAPALNYLGYLWADRGENLKKALALITRAVELDPSNGAYLDSLGWVHFKLGDLDLAEKNLLAAARLNPDDAAIEDHLGDVSEKRGDLEKARTRWKRALTLKPEDAEKIEAKLRRTDRSAGSAVNRAK